MKKRKLRLNPMGLMGKLTVFAYAIILTVPLYFVLITAFKTEQERIVNPIGLPIKATLESFVKAWIEGGLLRASMNSVIITFSTTFLVLCNIVLVSYCIHRIQHTKIGNVIYMYILSSMFIPSVGTATGLVMRRNLGLYNNLFGEIFCGIIGITTGVFLITGFLKTVPRELEEAAMLDGANDFQICTKVVVPLISPALVTLGINQFAAHWNDVLGPMLTLRDEKLYTIPMALTINFSNEISVEYATVFAGIVMTCIPIVIVFCKCQKYIISGMVGGVKG